MSACTKDFLDKKPISEALPEDVTAQPLLDAAYNNMYDEYYTNDYLVNGDVMSDNAYAGGDNVANFSIDKYTVNSTNGNVVRDWRYLYTDIKNCNLILNFVPTMQDPNITEERREQILGEASFLRAWHYFNLVRSWKEMPIPTEVPSNLGEMYLPKQSSDSVFKRILADLDFAATRVRSTSELANGRDSISTGAVNALYAKVYATMPNPDWNKVVEYCTKVEDAGYILEPEFAKLFAMGTVNNPESIWETQYDGVVHQNWIAGMNTPFMWGDWKKFNIPSHTIVNAYLDEKDTVRYKASIVYVTPSWTDDYWGIPTPVIGKYTDSEGRNTTYRLRLADILLLKAEALVELNQLADAPGGAAYYINMVRQRAHLGKTTATTKEDLKLAVEKERQLELAFEGHRMFDLIRTKRAVTVMNSVKDGDGNPLNYNVTEDELYFPMSQTEIDNNPNINN
ncbi:RagB/SusD family nutrient uptake outer membrane protein [Chitinophaga caeni]|uniref:RagB/SusD family nutrient uptake outer membrane protein n=2 Tax=Chitinophaga caeni TaxID=2029983 RepID=A0A291R0K0_9BACT|nr:RagB/SusD family nutrient uptake outer membrane protein [Chitinophaga caeni]